jgi:hypothetical protein
VKHSRYSVLALVLLAAFPACCGYGALHLAAGNFGGVALTVHSTDQLPLYAGLTPLRDNITLADIRTYYLPEDFQPIAPYQEEVTGRPGLQLFYDAYGIPHVYGQTRADVAFGAGWTTARDRGLLIQIGRGPARVAVADVPNIDAFSLVTSARRSRPSPEAEALVTQQVQLLIDTYGANGHEIIDDAQAYADGINAYWAAHNIQPTSRHVNDVLAVTAFIGSIFGAGGGGEAANSDLLAKLQQQLGADRGYKAWVDVMLADDPEAPDHDHQALQVRAVDRGRGAGSVVLDPGSIQSIDPRSAARWRAAAPASAACIELPRHGAVALGFRELARGDGPAARLLLPGDRAADRSPRPGYTAQGVAVPASPCTS